MKNIAVTLLIPALLAIFSGAARGQADQKSPVQSREVQQAMAAENLARHIIIRRTEHGVPHIEAENMLAAGFALGFVQMEDYGERVVEGLIRARGEWTKYNEEDLDDFEDAVDSDAASRRDYRRAVETWQDLKKDTRDITKGFAAGVNQYIQLYPDEFEDWVRPFFTAYDIHARGIGGPSRASIRTFIDALERREERPEEQISSSPKSPK